MIENDPCNAPPLSFMQAMAQTIVLSNGESFVNTIPWGFPCELVSDGTDCDHPAFDHESFVVQNIFAFDLCGRVAIKMNGSFGSEPPAPLEFTAKGFLFVDMANPEVENTEFVDVPASGGEPTYLYEVSRDGIVWTTSIEFTCDDYLLGGVQILVRVSDSSNPANVTDPQICAVAITDSTEICPPPVVIEFELLQGWVVDIMTPFINVADLVDIAPSGGTAPYTIEGSRNQSTWAEQLLADCTDYANTPVTIYVRVKDALLNVSAIKTIPLNLTDNMGSC